MVHVISPICQGLEELKTVEAISYYSKTRCNQPQAPLLISSFYQLATFPLQTETLLPHDFLP